MANKAKPTQREPRLIKLVTPEGERQAITASSYEEFRSEVRMILGVDDFGVFLENGHSALAPKHLDSILEHGLEQYAGRLVVLPSPTPRGCQSGSAHDLLWIEFARVRVLKPAPGPVPPKPINVDVDSPGTTAKDDTGEKLSPTPAAVPRPDATVVKVHADCKAAYDAVRQHRKHRYVLYGFTGDVSQIVVLKKANRNETYSSFTQDLFDAEKKGECRFAVYDVEYVEFLNDQKSITKNKIVFLMWCPDGAEIKQKMLYAASNPALKKALDEGIAKEIQANDHGDLEWTNILQRIGAPAPKL